jgi:endonuclease/exonuclease/phosphatase family metal-dependent hydrolase
MADASDVRICTWNIQWARGRDGRVDAERIAALLKAVDADVVCLQEVAINHPGLPGMPLGNQAQQLAAMLPHHESAFCAGSDLADGCGGRRQFGQLILSRLPMLQVFRHRLPWPADPAVPSMQRVALEVVIGTQTRSLRIVTTHLEYYSRRQRSAQVEALREIHAEGWNHAMHPRSSAEPDSPFAVLPRGEGTVLCGDFNFTPATAEYERLQEPFAGEAGTPRLVDAWTLLHRDRPHAPTFGLAPSEAIPAPECFDFFFVSENLAQNLRGIAVDSASEASDHQPVMLDIAL